MAIRSIKTGTFSRKMLVGNTAFDPAATFLIQRVTATGGQSSLSFTSIPQTYSSLQIRGFYRDTDNTTNISANLQIEFNADATAGNYTSHYLSGTGATAVAGSNNGNGAVFLQSAGMVSTTANIFAPSIIDIHDYASTTKNKTVRTFAGGDINAANTNIRVSLSSGAWLSTAAVTSIKIQGAYSSFAAGTTFALYGMK